MPARAPLCLDSPADSVHFRVKQHPHGQIPRNIVLANSKRGSRRSPASVRTPATARCQPSSWSCLSGTPRFIRKAPGRNQIDCVEPFREALVNQPDVGDCLSLTALNGQQACEARRGTQLQRQCAVAVRKIQGLPEEVLRRLRGGGSGLQQQKFTPRAPERHDLGADLGALAVRATALTGRPCVLGSACTA